MNIVGVWELVSFHVELGGESTSPFGPEPFGRILYDSSGWMSAVLMKTPRSSAGASLESARHSTSEDKAQAFDEYLSYTGRWRVEDLDGETTVVHEVDASLVPSVIGTALRRRATLDGDTLTLDYENRSRSGKERRFILRWRRP
ncbi:MAG: lipocalin-like domain-containing protein [Myxococcota bacterium]